MIIWVKREVVGANTNQRALVVGSTGLAITIQLLGDNREFVVRPKDIVGVEITKHLTIMFNFIGYCIQSGEKT